MGIIPKGNIITKCQVKLTFGANRVHLGVQRRLDVSEKQYFVDQAVKIFGTFLKDFKKSVDGFLFASPMCRDQMFSDGRVMMLTDALMCPAVYIKLPLNVYIKLSLNVYIKLPLNYHHIKLSLNYYYI